MRSSPLFESSAMPCFAILGSAALRYATLSNTSLSFVELPQVLTGVKECITFAKLGSAQLCHAGLC
jgi:hypothetical protein